MTMKLFFSAHSAKLAAVSLIAALAVGCDGGPVKITITAEGELPLSSSSSSEDANSSGMHTSLQLASSAMAAAYSSNDIYRDSSSSVSGETNSGGVYASSQLISSATHAAYSSHDVIYSDNSNSYEPNHGANVSVGSQDLGLEYWANLCMECHTYSGEAPVEGLIDLNIRDWHWEDFSEYVQANMPASDPESCNGACARHITAFLLDEQGLLDFINHNPNSPYPDIATVSSNTAVSSSNSISSYSGNEGDIDGRLVFPLDMYSIDNQGLAVAFNKNTNAMAYGAIGGGIIFSPAKVDGTEEWTHASRYQLHDLRFSEDGQLLLATLEAQVRVLDPATGEVLDIIETSSPATETFSVYGDIVVVTEQDGTYLASSYQWSKEYGARYFRETEFYSPVSFEVESGYVWARLQVEQTKAVINRCILRGGVFLCDDYGSVKNDLDYEGYIIHEFDGKFEVSPNDEWILTQGNNLLSTDTNLTPGVLGWHSGRQGFADFDFSPSGTLSAIDGSGRPQFYDNVEPGAEPIPLDPEGYFEAYNLTQIIALDEGTFAVAQQPGGQFWLVVLSPEIFKTGVSAHSSFSSADRSSSPYIPTSTSSVSSSSKSVAHISSADYVSYSSSQIYESSSSMSILDHPYAIDLNVSTIDDKGLTIALDKTNGALYYGAIHGKTITSLGGINAAPWSYTGEQRLFDLTLSQDNQTLLATFENEVRAFDTASGEDLGVITTTGKPAYDVMARGRQDVYIATGSNGDYQVQRYFWRGEWFADKSSNHFSQAPNLEMAGEQIWVREQHYSESATLTFCDNYIHFACDSTPIAITEAAAQFIALPNGSSRIETYGQFIASPDGRWIVTQGNNIVSTQGIFEPFQMPQATLQQGFIDMDFTETGALVAINHGKKVVGYEYIDPYSQPIFLGPEEYLPIGDPQHLLVLPNNISVISEASDGRFYLIPLGPTLNLAPLPLPLPPVVASSSSSVSPVPTPQSSSSSYSSASSSYRTQASSSSSAPAPSFGWAMAPSIEWVEAGGWQLDTVEYGTQHSNVYVALAELGPGATINPRPTDQFTEITLHITVFDTTKRFRINYDVIPASGEDVQLNAHIVDQVIVGNDSPANAGFYTASFEFTNTILAGNDMGDVDWTSFSNEFDYWGSSGIALKLKSANGAPFHLKGLSIKEVGPSTMGDGKTYF